MRDPFPREAKQRAQGLQDKQNNPTEHGFCKLPRPAPRRPCHHWLGRCAFQGSVSWRVKGIAIAGKPGSQMAKLQAFMFENVALSNFAAVAFPRFCRNVGCV